MDMDYQQPTTQPPSPVYNMPRPHQVYFPFDLLEELDALEWEGQHVDQHVDQRVDQPPQFVVATVQDRLEEMDRHAEESFEMRHVLKRLRINIPEDSMLAMEDDAGTPAVAKKPRTDPPSICPLDDDEKMIDGVWLG